ncbi:ATP-binding protein [Stackebrandtia nassauensis]|uniref:CO dehydrogenase maturation factor-like protein n=1 Tax=Stackebrandtia nassauensis (strain DSM 44728 / CIP 108903 / NRRL B-16338 / NBRC 102104 / LLR-40K-21) TaxID=446470 RepID=D3Q8T5_STANL|nr:ATP-binding protein [Stackebrandtia nassauensis]ADD44527.1 CO dehydrogenase maturation factor-like protein [Stackebrandtia nassauensis DSM 44728]
MKIAFVGKGGSGKTTLASLFARRAVAAGHPVFAIDADINQHLAAALGVDEDTAAKLPKLGDHLAEIKEYLRGDNPRIASAEAMVKTTPPGSGSRLLTIGEDNPVYDACVRNLAGLRLAVTGGFAEDDLGVACYHSKVGAVELMLNHLVDGPGEYVIVDMVAGAEAFASGLFTRFDRTFLVCEPTVRSVGVYKQYAEYAADYDVAISVIGNKIDEPEDVDFLREHVGDALFGWCGRSKFVKAAERGSVGPIADLEPENLALLDRARELVELGGKDWARFSEQARLFHRRNAEAWGNSRMGVDLSEQIDPDFVLGPDSTTDTRGMAKVS